MVVVNDATHLYWYSRDGWANHLCILQLQRDSSYSGISRGCLNCILLCEIDHVVDVDTGFEPK